MTRVILLAALGLAGCGGSNGPPSISVQTTPPGASCLISRNGALLGTVEPTPGSLSVTSSDKDILVTCRKPGWRTASVTVRAIYGGEGVGRLLSSGVAGVVEDAVNSTGFHYDPAGANIQLTAE